jgi:hypothetical protein
MMNNMEGSKPYSDVDEGLCDLEFEVVCVELGDNFMIILEELENGDPFYMVQCTKPLHRCPVTFEDEWGNIWYEGDMILNGIWYYRLPSHTSRNSSYSLLLESFYIFILPFHYCVTIFNATMCHKEG